MKEGLGLGCMTNRFDVVPVRTNDEGCIVARMVVRTKTGRTVVLAAGLQGCVIKGPYLLSSVSNECDMKRCGLISGLEQTQRGIALAAKLDPVRRITLGATRYSEWFKCSQEEGFACCIVTDSELDVIKHAISRL